MDLAAPSVTLIGTVHRDPRGEQKLRLLLERLRPDLLTLEMSEKALAYRQGEARHQLLRLDRILARLAAERGREAGELQSRGAIADIRTLLALPFEYRAAAAYAEAAGIPLRLIDLSEISTAKLRRVEADLITYRNVRVLVDLPEGSERSPAEGYGTARSLTLGGAGEAVRQAFLQGRRGEEGIGPRDRHMEQEIRRLLAARAGRLVHVGGWVHLVEDGRGETLFSRLADLEPQRLLLED
jgi:pheromone shutdown protein TraB